VRDPDPEARWDSLAEEALDGVRRWRQEHPTATLTEIEAAVDERLGGLRARVVADAAGVSAAAAARPVCPACGTGMHADGTETRHLTTVGDRSLALRRTRLRCPACGAGLFPPR
jgi:YgiT-type zinc finger domain-containing protein